MVKLQRIRTKRTRAFLQGIVQSSINSPNTREKISAVLNNLNIPQLSEEQKNSSEGLISPEECSELLDSFQSNKSPGNDGIPAEFYRLEILAFNKRKFYQVRK